MSEQQDRSQAQRPARRRSRLVALSLALIAVLLVGGTLAYFTNTGSGDYAFALNGRTQVKLVGGFQGSDGAATASIESFLPGSVVTDKRLGVQNEGNDCYVMLRLRIRKTAPTLTGGMTKEQQAAAIKGGSADEVTSVATLNQVVATLYGNGGLTGNDALTASTVGTRATLIGRYGYVFAGSTLDSAVSFSYGSTAGSADTASGTTLLKNGFKNMTTAEEYRHGLLTFMYQGTLKSGADPVYLIDAIAAPTDFTEVLGAYTITAWADTVPAADYASVDAALARLAAIAPATNYYDASAPGAA